ncbi:MAG: hypothetical protein NC099_06260 [Corallococcus sp.]|nr:hypothetical protein [Bacillota bacterium]MCM1534236.1 hypothetical protein [Corallococcus sp.]
MFLRLTDINGNLILINADKVVDVSLEKYKQDFLYTVHLVDGSFVFVRETVSEISLLLQSSNRVIK